MRRLVAAARQGDRDAFGELVVLYERTVLRTTLAALGAREDAEDVAQEAFVIAWRRLGGFRGEASFKTWLLTIAWRKALDRRRRRARWRMRDPLPVRYEESDSIETLADEAPDPERRALVRDLKRRIAAGIARLTPKLRDTLLLASSGAHTYDEIAVLLGVPVGTIKWRVAEARRLLAVRVGPDASPAAGSRRESS